MTTTMCREALKTAGIADDEVVGFCEFVDVVCEAIATSPKREMIAETVDTFGDDCADKYGWATGAHAPSLLYVLMMEIRIAASREAPRKEAVKDTAA